MNGTIIFKITIANKYGGYMLASNFISKIYSGEQIRETEVKGITSFHCGDIDAVGNNQIVKIILSEKDNFKEIKKPELIKDVIKDYKIVYCLWIEELFDLVDLQYDCLIKVFFKEVSIISIFLGDVAFYHKVSHFLYDVGHCNSNLYNSNFFVKDELKGKVIRLQKQNVGGLTHFMPIHLFNEEENILFDSLELHISKTDLTTFFLEKNLQLANFSPVLRGCLKILKESKVFVDESNIKDIVDLLSSGTIFSFLLFAYSFNVNLRKGKMELSNIKSYFSKIKEYTLGCGQLIENVIHHSMTKCGAISVRFHETNSQYLKMRYGEKIEDTPYLEILITDYAGINVCGNIADHFRLHIEDEIKADFEDLQPIDFLIKDNLTERAQIVEDAFLKYYRNSEHIGKHIGLKVFRNIIEEHEGIFGFYSHRSHEVNEGENYQFFENKTDDISVQCVPGTGYTVIFPLKKTVASITRAEIGIDDNIHLEENIEYFINGYCCEKVDIKECSFTFANQKEKEDMIYTLSKKLNKNRFDESEKSRIVYISAKYFSDEYAEYIAKALLMAGSVNHISDYVIYDCSRSFEKSFQNTMHIYFEMKDLDYLYKDKEFVIALYTETPVESCFFIPGHLKKTIWVNKRNSYAGVGMDGYEWMLSYPERDVNIEKNWKDIPPYDILFEPEDGTIFEKYTLQVLNTDIQEHSFGCKITDTHMRLGSTIHIDNFYEAELLFNNRLFASRFAYLLVKKMYDEGELQKLEHITLYSYALYSENLIVEIMNILEKLYPQKDVDYAILEREAEHREFTHIDRIRYSRPFVSKTEKSEYFRDRSLICVVPVNSTLKTHEKLISLFCEDNEEFSKENIVSNYALILVGSEKENKYWEIDEKNRTFTSIALDINPVPNYCVLVKVKYYEALGCELCFPQNPLDEVPIVEVNAASTIPNQSFGVYWDETTEPPISYHEIKEEENKLSVLKDSLIYSHTKRGENHYLYYFKTDELFLNNKLDIIEWLVRISKEIEINQDEYHVLFCPAHFSNAGFLECINRIIFHDAALIIRVDVDKEYRSNILAKYSNLASFVELLSKDNTRKHTIKVYYIDDSIITGRTFQRAKSLISSLVQKYNDSQSIVEVHIFEKIFVLLDRNSKQSRLQYINCWNNKDRNEQLLDTNFYAYRTLHISSMRNHGDSCVLCQLEREAQILYQTSATKQMTNYWKATNKKFEVKPLRDKQEEINQKRDNDIPKDKAFRRMFCSHIVAMALSETRHGNRKERAVSCLLQLLIEDYNGRKKQYNQEIAFEYMLSYLKIISRPFMVFDKTIKESAFDIQLIITECVLAEQKVSDIIEQTNKTYLKTSKDLFITLIEKNIREEFSLSQKMDLLLLLMKQLTEMKSNYFIRSMNIAKIVRFAKHAEKNSLMSERLYRQYLQQTKKILGVSSDTSKSAWFNHEITSTEKIPELPNLLYENLVLENTRAYFDGIERLSKNIKLNEEDVDFLCTKRWYGPEFKHYETFKQKLESDLIMGEPEIVQFLKDTFRDGTWEVSKRERRILEESDPKKKFDEYYEKIKSRHCAEKSAKEIRNLLDILNKELEKSQYRDFNAILDDLEYRKNSLIDEDGLASILASVQLMLLCNQRKNTTIHKGNIEDICYKVACLIEKIIRAKEVKIVLECPLECDEWEDDIRRRFNEILEKYLEKGKQKELYLDLQEKKEYLEIANSSMKPEIIEAVEIKVAEHLISYREDKIVQKEGFYVDNNERYMIWEIGGDDTKRDEKQKLLVYAEFYELDDLKVWQRLRNLFCMYYMLNNSMFNTEDMDYLFELILADKERLMYNLDKAHSHTAETVKSLQCEFVKDEEEVVDGFRSFVLTLLSDLQVSQVYRQSLKRSYYCKNVRLYSKTCETIFDVFYKDRSLIVINKKTSESRYLNICIEFPECGVIEDDESKLEASDQILSFQGANGKNDIFLLLLALIMNAAGPDRGTRERNKDGNDDVRDIKVYITKTKDGCLRIANKSDEEKKDIDSVNEELRFPPQKDKGISLWSVSRYVRGLVSICLSETIKKVETDIQLLSKQIEIEERLSGLKRKLEYALGDAFVVKANVTKNSDGIKYFYMDIPILSEKYNNIKTIERK